MGRLTRRRCRGSLLAIVLLSSSGEAEFLGAEGSGGGLRGQLEALAAAEGFAVRGLGRVDSVPAKPVSDDDGVVQRLRGLLDEYDYVLIYDAAGGVAEVRISGRRPPPGTPAPRYAVRTLRRDSHHVVDALVTGPNLAQHPIRMIVDTGATTVVLPRSMMESLGFRPEDLGEGWAQTVNGRLSVKWGRLESVTIGEAIQRDVTVSFIDDERIGGQALLGMSFLDRFRVTIDDATHQLILRAR